MSSTTTTQHGVLILSMIIIGTAAAAPKSMMFQLLPRRLGLILRRQSPRIKRRSPIANERCDFLLHDDLPQVNLLLVVLLLHLPAGREGVHHPMLHSIHLPLGYVALVVIIIIIIIDVVS